MIVSLHGVTKTYRTEFVETNAVRDVSVEIPEGEYVAVTGPSGSGKTTLASLIGLLDNVTDGRLVFDGADLTTANDRIRARQRRDAIGFVFQAFHLISHLDAMDNVAMSLSGYGLTKRQRRDAAEAALVRLGMGSRLRHFPNQLSGGQQQRVALARAIVRKPRLLICDEPTGNLDSENGESVLAVLDELHAEGTTLVVVTHDEAVAARAVRRIGMKDGSIIT